MKKLCIALLLLTASLNATSKYPVDVCYLVADLKYSKENGVKICEIQHGILSTLHGDAFLNGNQGLILPQIENIFAKLPIKKWTATPDIDFKPLTALFKTSPGWTVHRGDAQIFEDPSFQQVAAILPNDPNDIASYQGLVFIRANSVKNYDTFRKKHPGIIVAGAPSYTYWVDKYKMSLLFTHSPELEKVKPEWGLYPKKYTRTLAQTIMQDIPGNRYVIKPRGAFLGNGVIIVSKEDLDDTLQYILQRSKSLTRNTDKAYNYWNRDRFDSFIVEKYYDSDEVTVEAFKGKTYQPTMRAAFILSYNNQKIDFQFLGGYWLLPVKSVDQEGTLNELTKAHCKIPFFTHATDEVVEEVGKQLEHTMPILYQKMLEEQ